MDFHWANNYHFLLNQKQNCYVTEGTQIQCL